MPPPAAPHDPSRPLHTIAIVGAGFSGAVTAVQLLRQARQPLKVVLINESGRMARGLAYGTSSPDHVLNVPAGNMSALADDPDDFLRYCRWANQAWQPTSFVPRKVYGAHLEALLGAAESGSRPRNVEFERITARVTGLTGSDSPYVLHFDDGRRCVADQVVLAFGHFAPRPPLSDAQISTLGDRYVADPWRSDLVQRVGPDDRVLLLGAGLSALDVMISLDAHGHHGEIVAASRRGLPPLPHRAGGHGPAIDGAALVAAMGSTLRGQVRELRQRTREGMQHGDDWRDWIGALRPHTPNLWRSLSLSDRQRFLRHVRPYWDVLRHRCAPDAYQVFERLHTEGRLSLLAARVVDVRPSDDGAQIGLALRAGPGVRQVRTQWVVNCTGPSSSLRQASSPLVRALLEAGQVKPDPLNIGLEVGDDYAVLDAQGRPHPALCYVGPLLKAREWESTAVPELRRHAEQLARVLLARSAHRGQPA